MPNVILAVQDANDAGVTPTRNAIATGNDYLVRNSGRIALLFEKTGAGVATITIKTPATLGGLAVAERTISVPATTGDVTGAKFAPAIYNDGNGDLSFSTDEGTGLTCAVLAI